MKRTAFFILLVCCLTGLANADVAIGDKTYHADTISRRQVGPGMITTIIRLPEFPLNIYVTETDLNNPNNRVETTLGQSTVGKTETLINAVKRNRTATKRPIVACNSNFWCVSAEFPPREFELGTPYCSVVRNDTIYVNAETNEDNWCYGPGHTGGTAISRDKTLYFNHIIPSGTISGSKFNAPVEFSTVNRRCINDHISFWTPAYSRTRSFETDWVNAVTRGETAADNYYLTLKEGSRFGINHDMTFVVSKIVKGADRQTLGEFDACFTCSGSKKDILGVLSEGDEITVNYGMMVAGDPNQRPEIENMVEGIGLVMLNGELTANNFDGDYNQKTYSRTGYGASADGKKLIMMVIDMSLSKKYGRSAGCNTETMCRIMQSLCPYVNNITTMDAGGSAMMIVRGECISTTTEGTPRAVACGWMVEAVGEEDNTIASIAFDDFRVEAPIYSSFTPRILGYNTIGELVDEDVKGFTLSCDENIGTTEADTFIACGTEQQGTLYAHLGDMTTQVRVNTLAAQPAIKVKPLLIDDRDYPIEVVANVNENTYTYDPAKLQWNIDDPDIISIENGVLKALKNGKTRITCQIGEFNDEDSVIVEISNTPYRFQTWNDWTIKGSGAKNFNLADDGTLTYTYNSARAPYVSLKKDVTLYSLPDTVAIKFNSTIPIDYIQLDTRNPLFTSSNYMRYDNNEQGFEANKDHTIQIDLATLGGIDNVATYPILIKEIKFTPDKNADTGEQTLSIKAFYSHYNVPPIKGDINQDGTLNVSDVTELINMILGSTPLNKAVADVDDNNAVNVSDVTELINLLLR